MKKDELKKKIEKRDPLLKEEGWHLWIELMDRCFTIAQRDEFIVSWGERGKTFDFDLLESTYRKLSNIKEIPDDIRRFIAFMTADGYLKFHKITLDDFLKCGNMNKPELGCQENELSVIELLHIKGGDNWLRMQLMGIGWWKF